MSETALAVLPQQIPEYLTPEKRELIKTMICPTASDDEFELFLYQCKRTGLDPLARQIYAVKRWNSGAGREMLTAQTSIDGFRLVAERTKTYQGQTETLWCDQDGKWYDIWLHDFPPVGAKVGVHREGFKEPLYAVARYDDYAARNRKGDITDMWVKMGPTMVAKCAESLALRKAFPHELSGIYTAEEMAQAERVDDEKVDEKLAAERAAKAKTVEIPGAVSAHPEPLPDSDDERTPITDLLMTVPPEERAAVAKELIATAKPVEKPAPVSRGLEGSRTGARRVTPAPDPKNPMRHPVRPEGTVVEAEIVSPTDDAEMAKAKATVTLRNSPLGELTRENLQYLVNNEATFLKQGASMNRLEDAANCITACKYILAH